MIKDQDKYIEELQTLLDYHDIPYEPRLPINNLDREGVDKIVEQTIEYKKTKRNNDSWGAPWLIKIRACITASPSAKINNLPYVVHEKHKTQKQIKRWCITAALQIKKKFHNVGCKGSIIRANLQILPELFCFI